MSVCKVFEVCILGFAAALKRVFYTQQTRFWNDEESGVRRSFDFTDAFSRIFVCIRAELSTFHELRACSEPSVACGMFWKQDP